MKHLSEKFILIPIFLIYSSLNAQENNRFLFQNRISRITVDEFRDRYEFMPHLNYSDNPDSAKKEFLYSLIAEKLWAAEAAENGIDTLVNVRGSLSALKKLFLKDELYRKEVSARISITDEDLAKGMQRITRKLNISIAASNSSEIHSIHKAVKSGTDFDSLVKSMDGSYIRYSTSEITLSSLIDEKIIDILFSLNPGEISEPVFSKGNWLLFFLRSEEDIREPDTSPEHLRNKVFTIIKNRREQSAASEFITSILGGRSVNADRQVFMAFSSELNKIITKRTGVRDTTDVLLNETDLMQYLNTVGEKTLSSELVSLENNPASLRDFIFYLIYQKINFSSLNENAFNSVLSAALRNFIEDEILSREAVKRGMHRLPSLLKDFQIWRDFYLSEVTMSSNIKKIIVSESDIEQFMESSEKAQELLQVNIIEILTSGLSEVEFILNEIKNGKDFGKLAEMFNTREWTKNSKGEWGYFSVGSGGEIGRIASEMKPGEIFGPLKLPEGYSIFKLINKRRIAVDSTMERKVNTELIRTQVALKKTDELLNKRTAELARKYGLNINEELLEELELSPLNTFTYRLIGFGGKIAALPVTIPMFEWYNLFISEKELP